MYTKKITVFVSIVVVGLAVLLSGCSPAPEPAAASPSNMTPEEVVKSFYNGYITYPGNPLVDEAYRSSEYLTEEFIQKVDGIIASFDKGGYDPFLCAQDIPGSFTINDTVVVSGKKATVIVQEVWNPGTEYESIQEVEVALRLMDGQWKITDITCNMPEPAAMTPEQVVEGFYDWYLDYARNVGNPLVEKAYHDSPLPTDGWKERVDEIVAGFEGGGYDPFLCAQDIPTTFTTEQACMGNQVASVMVRTDFPGHLFTVDLTGGDLGWQISNVTCATSPEGMTKAFYAWYLGYIGDPASGDFHNPLSDKAYRDSGFFTERFVAEVDALFDAEGGIAADPFLMAQALPQAFTIDPGLKEGTAIVHLRFDETVHHLQVTLVQEQGRWLIDSVEQAETPPSAAPVDEGGSAVSRSVFVSSEYGFSFAYPGDWVLQEMNLTGPGMPDDWPVAAGWQLMPPEVAEQMAAQSGPPDPNAPPVIAPLQIEVTMGDLAAFDRVYVPAASSETAVWGGNTITIQHEGSGSVRYVFQHPQRPDVWVVVTDWVTKFPGREAQAEAVTGTLESLLNSFVFGE